MPVKRDEFGRFVGRTPNPPRRRVPSKKVRGSGISGLKKNTVPYVRVNRKGATVGVNTGTIIPGTRKRIAVGGYIRTESLAKNGARKIKARRAARFFPKGSKRAGIADWTKKNVSIKNPAIRGTVAGHEVRLGTSRRAGPTLIARRGTSSTPKSKSRAGVQKYDRRMSTIAGQKARKKAKSYKPRPQRRGR